MKKIALILLLTVLGSFAHAQELITVLKHPVSVWTHVQTACSGNTGCPAIGMAISSTSATATLSPTSSGDSLQIHVLVNTTSTAPSSVTCVTVACTVVGPDTNCKSANSGTSNTIFCYYVLSTSSGSTGVTVTFATSTVFGFVVDSAHKNSGSATFDTSGNTTQTTCISCVVSNLTLTGSSDYVFISSTQLDAAAVSGSYTIANPLTTDLTSIGFYGVNISSGTGPTITYGSSGAFTSSQLALK